MLHGRYCSLALLHLLRSLIALLSQSNHFHHTLPQHLFYITSARHTSSTNAPAAARVKLLVAEPIHSTHLHLHIQHRFQVSGIKAVEPRPPNTGEVIMLHSVLTFDLGTLSPGLIASFASSRSILSIWNLENNRSGVCVAYH